MFVGDWKSEKQIFVVSYVSWDLWILYISLSYVIWYRKSYLTLRMIYVKPVYDCNSFRGKDIQKNRLLPLHF